jgi:SulP family sulfate permease
MLSFNPLSEPPNPATSFRARQSEAMHQAWRHWLSNWRDVFSHSPVRDLLASITVAAVALPLNVALAVAAGLPPTAGLVAGAVGGGLAAIFGGAPLAVSGPAAALNMLVLGIFVDFGAQGVAAAALLVGLSQLFFAFTLAGRLVQRVPESVLAGFLTGVGLTLLSNQIPEVLGFNYRVIDLAQMMTRPAWLHDVSWLAVAAGLFVAFLVVTTAQYRRFPAAIVGIGLITFVAVYLDWDIERVGPVPSSLPSLSVPFVAAERWLALLARVAPLALLCAAESLLTARAVDRMSGRTHDSNLELFGQGIANIGTALMSGMPVTGVIVRSGVNVQSGGRTRLASLCHSLLLILAVVFLSDSIAQVPLTALAGFLCVIAFRLIELRTLVHLLQTAWIDALAFLATAVGTVTDHLFLGLLAGLALHAVHVLFHPTRAKDRVHRPGDPNVRAVIAAPERERITLSRAKKSPVLKDTPHANPWLEHIRDRPYVPPTAYVHPKASVIGRVVLGDDVHVAADTSLRADEGSPFHIGAGSNVQDGVILHALKNRCVRVGGQPWAIYVGRNVSIAHDALVHGPCYIGDDTFIGFKAVVHDSVVGNNCYIGIGAVVVGVEIPDGRAVPHGAIVDSADAVDRLPPASEAHSEFNHDVVEVNRGLAVAYHRVRSDIHHHPAATDSSSRPLRPRDRF